MLDVAEARARLLAALTPADLVGRRLALADAAGQVAALDVDAQVANPPFRRAVMDGYACRAADLPGPLPVAFEVPAGSAQTRLDAGQCARIFTGAPVPDGADVVVPQENLRSDEGGVLLDPSIQSWIRPVGDDIQIGQRLVSAGQSLGPVELGLLAAGGHADVVVQSALKVALITTGDEVRPPGSALESGQIHSSNAVSLMALLAGWGVQAEHHHVADDYPAMVSALSEVSARCDLLVTVGGVSAGDYDWVRPAIQALGQIESYRVRMKPGKPFAFGQIGTTPVCCVPGNPASALVTSLLFVWPAIQALRGQQQVDVRLPVRAKFAAPAAQRRRFLRVRWDGDGLCVHANQDSGSITPMAWATGLGEIAPDTAVADGDSLVYWPFSQWF